MRSTECFICGNNKFEIVGEFGEKTFQFKIIKCKKCKLEQQDRIPSRKNLEKLYQDIYNKKYDLPLAHEAFEVKNEKKERGRLSEILKFVKRGKLLDYGASTGFFVEYVNKQKGFKASGIEYSKFAVGVAKRNKIPIIHGEIGKLKLPDNGFDIVTMHAVFDHLPNPGEALKTVYEKIKPGGYFIFSVANTDSFEKLMFKFMHKKYSGYIFEHLYYYNKENVVMMLEKKGYKNVRITSRHYGSISLPPKRPFVGWITFPFKLFLEHTMIGGSFKKGNILYIFARK